MSFVCSIILKYELNDVKSSYVVDKVVKKSNDSIDLPSPNAVSASRKDWNWKLVRTRVALSLAPSSGSMVYLLGARHR